jgi:hypothetical protein
MDREQFIQMLESHDWYYMFSDDHQQWTKGRQERAEIMMAIQANEREMRPIFEQYLKDNINQEQAG